MSRGGAREGAGRPVKNESEKVQRAQHQVRAFDDEWEIIKKFADIVKSGRKEKCKKIIDELESF